MHYNLNLLLLIFTGLTIFLCIERDGGHIKNDSHLWHSADAANRIVLSAYISLINFHDLRFACLFLCCYWLCFDMGLNIKRGLPLLFVGTTAWMDTLIKKPILMLTLKIISMSISIIMFLTW